MAVGVRVRFLNAAVLRRTALYVALVVGTASCGGGDHTVTSPSCSFALSPSSASQPASGGTGSVSVTAVANCSWGATSDVDWVTVTGGSSGQGGGIVTYSVAPNTDPLARSAAIKVVHDNGQSVALFQISQQGTTNASPGLSLKGAYTFSIEVDPGGACRWPVTRFLWPVSVEIASHAQGTTVGLIVFPPTPSAASNKWSISASPASTQLTPGQGSPGPAAAAYDVVVEGGRWEAGSPTRARDGRGEISSGTASGARLILVLPGSDKRWECRADAKWSLLVRYVDQD